MSLEAILFLVIGAVIGWFFQRLTDLLTGPKFKIEGITGSVFQLPGTTNKFKFLNVKATNIKRGFLRRLFVGNSTATNARVRVYFLDTETKAELLEINGRWTSTKEPVDYRGNINIGDALIISRETIPPGESAEISIAVKEETKTDCYAFNNESYLYSWFKQDFLLDQKRYIVRVLITSDGKEWSKEFTMLNLGTTLRNFKII